MRSVTRVMSAAALMPVLLLTAASDVLVQTTRVYYVRAGAAGARNGANWTDAFSALPSTLERGATYYIADGSYGAYRFDDALSGTTPLLIRKATLDDHGTNTGWQSSFGDGQAVFSGADTLVFDTDYVLFDGQTGGGPGNWTRGFGFKVTCSSGNCLDVEGSHVTLRHVEAQGNGGDGAATPANDLVAIDSTVTNTRISYAYLYDAGRTIFFSRGKNVVVEYIYTGYFESTSAQHSEIASLGNPREMPASNFTFRHSVFTHGEGTGGLIFNGDRLEVYGCVFVGLPGSTWSGNGAIATWSWGTLTNAKIYNNSFINVGKPIGDGSLGTLTGVFRNNVVYSSSSPTFGQIVHDYNYYAGMTAPTEANRMTGTSDPFLNYLTLDFRLKTATLPGATLAAPYDVDPFNNGRGRDGVWDRGAYEQAGILTMAPGAPTSVRILR